MILLKLEMKKLILILSFFNICLCFSQNIELPVINVYQSECDRFADITRIQKRIISQRMNNDTLTVLFGTIENCAGIYDVKSYLICDTLKFEYRIGIPSSEIAENGDNYVSVANCDCCFEFTFEVQGLKYSPKVIKLFDSIMIFYPDKYKIYPVKFDLINNDTVNYIDKYGLKQGKWLKTDCDVKADSIYFVGYYIDNELKSCFLNAFNKNGKLIYEDNQTDYNVSVSKSYFENGDISEQWIDNDSAGFISYSFYPNKHLKRVKIKNKNFEGETDYYESGILEKITNEISTEELNENGEWKQTFINSSRKEFYENGILKIEYFDSERTDNIWKKIYYDNGNLMAIKYSKSWDKKVRFVAKKRNGQGKLIRTVSHGFAPESKHWYKYYDISGKKVSKKDLEEKGYKDLLD
jgi:hypothetical protein